ncbi:component of SufBCD complex [Mangrovicoccus sp. HB161399]|uniref:component of SufBCD complex n=1 Tax=Mangrovicoccus sp. HB161399 TaxID=2720392 RepID=UPI001551A5E0|nr:component of SufBCD complex [Mangrovicoccus sp. HB161399]
MPLSPFDLISASAFSSLWYWIVVALVWTRVAHAPMGIPMDHYDRARAVGGDEDAFALLRAGVARQLGHSEKARVWFTGVWAFALSSLLGLSLLGAELAQALLVLALPLAIGQLLVFRTARRMSQMEPEVGPLMAELKRLRLWLQLLSLAAIFVSAVIGMNQVLARAYL